MGRHHQRHRRSACRGKRHGKLCCPQPSTPVECTKNNKEYDKTSLGHHLQQTSGPPSKKAKTDLVDISNSGDSSGNVWLPASLAAEQSPQKSLKVECSCCHRQETPLSPLELATVPGKFARRRYGDYYNLDLNSLVCSFCFRYISIDSVPTWANAWAAFFYSEFTKKYYIKNKESLLELLPTSVRDMWANSVHTFVPCVQKFWKTCPSKFKDITHEVHHFKSNKEKLKLGNLLDMMNSYPYPTIRCPLGCYMFIDDLLEGKLECVDACHLIASIDDSFNDFGACAQTFSGRHPSWPEMIQELEWTVSPSLYFDPVHGLCVVQCNASIHSSAVKKYVHVPHHPILESNASGKADILAPYVVTTSNARSGYSNPYSTSYPVMNSRGCFNGISSFNISAWGHSMYTASSVELLSWGLTLSQRPVITSFLNASSPRQKLWLKTVLDSYSHSLIKPPEDLIKRCSSKATFVSVGDSIHYARATNTDLLTDNEERMTGDTTYMPKESLAVVHSNDTVGQVPFPVPLFQGRRNIGDRTGCVLHVIVSALLHCRELNRLFLRHASRAPNRTFHQIHGFMEYVACNGTDYRTDFTWAIESLLIEQTFTANPHLHKGASAERLASYILARLCEVERVEVGESFNVEDYLCGRSGVYIFDSSTNPFSQKDLLLVDKTSSFSLKFVSHIGLRTDTYNQVNVAFRWLPSSKWISCCNDRKFTTHEDMPIPTVPFFIYCSDKEDKSHAREEFFKMCGDQCKVNCFVHDQKYLMLEQNGSALICCSADCNAKLDWRCSEGYPSHQCTLGLCWNHFLEAEHVVVCEQNAKHEPGEPAKMKQKHESKCNRFLTEKVQMVDDPLLRSYDFYVVDPSDCIESLPSQSSTIDPQIPNSSLAPGHHLLNNCLKLMSQECVKGSVPLNMQEILHSIYSRSESHIIPLLYPESVLFPKIFWTQTEGAPVGALPSSFFNHKNAHEMPNDYAPLQDHLRVRLLDGSLLTSRDPYYLVFAFDTLLNSKLTKDTASVAMEQGLEIIDQTLVDDEDNKWSGKINEINSQPKVCELSSFLKDIGLWNYFITLTCNDSETFGIAPIRRAIERKCRGNLEMLTSMLQSHCVIMCRAWERVVRHYFHYVLHSPERPLGHVKGIWYRFDFNSESALGKKPHVHCGVTLHPNSLNEEVDVQRITCLPEDMFTEARQCDKNTLVRDGIIKDSSEFMDLVSLAEKLLMQSSDHDGLWFCAQSKNKESQKQRHVNKSTYSYSEHNLYDEATLANLEWLDLAQVDAGTLKPHDDLIGRIWHYPADPSMAVVPTVPRVFAAFRSVTSVKYCDKKFHTAYMMNFCAGVSGKRDDFFSQFNKTQKGFDASKNQNNATESASKEKQQENENVDKQFERETSLTDMVWFSLNLPYVSTSVEFVSLSTHLPEHRTITKKSCSSMMALLMNDEGVLKSVIARKELPPWRQFSNNQLALIEDFCNGCYHMDRTSSFNFRPPELRLIKQLSRYCLWFTRFSNEDHRVSDDLTAHPLLDGASCCVRVRFVNLHDVREYFGELSHGHDDVVCEQARAMHGLYTDLVAAVHKGDLTSEFVIRFVDVDKCSDAVVVMTPINPFRMSTFLYHLMLCFGEVETEVELMQAKNYLEAFKVAKVIDNVRSSGVQNNVKTIIRKYVLEQLTYLPVGSKEFSKVIAFLIAKLKKFFRHQSIVLETNTETVAMENNSMSD